MGVERTLEEYKVVPHEISESGKLIVQPYDNSQRKVVPICRRNYPNYKVMVHKIWSGNGHDSMIFVWDIKKDAVRLVRPHTFTEVVQYLEGLTQ